VKIVRDKKTSKCVGYGFVKFLSSQSALEARKKLSGYQLGSKVLKVDIARGRDQLLSNCKIYTSGIPLHYDEDRVDTLFSQVCSTCL
jgi:RNA recognition motif-containing protein